jgi:hypothetical protein
MGLQGVAGMVPEAQLDCALVSQAATRYAPAYRQKVPLRR